ncbi:hypothetical protein [Halomonas sp. QHL1]|uniref:hypothetical protein n=1 Tax=Halomonas sp. QHL1 TaxID=1123773 RepID=UPI0008FD94FC|nr:hypothetical protein [Halomonas sp. QHL1]OJA05152.1 hypothetical protein QHL1GM_06970 [Halomonas sp. QHL1]
MKLSINTEKNLKSRLEYFCSRSTSSQALLMDFVEKTFSDCNPYIFGGVIRDIGLNTLRKFSSDIDIVYEGELSLDKIPVNTSRNKFGGYRTIYGKWIIDFWKIEDTWAFKNGFYRYESPESILKTTITNLESAIFDIKRKKLICSERYIKDIKDRYIEINNKVSPNRKNTLVKIIVTIYKKEIALCNPNVLKFFNEVIADFEAEELESALKNKGVPRWFLLNLKRFSQNYEQKLLPIKTEYFFKNQSKIIF